MENKEKLYNIYYGEKENEYIRRYLKDEEIINGYLTEAKAFNLFFDDMILCNNYLQNNFDNLETLLSCYDGENDYCKDEYQFFIVNPTFDEYITTKAVEKMGNTLYYDNILDLYLIGVCDFGMSRRLVPTNLKVKE